MRLTFLDAGGSDWMYAPEFLVGKEDKHWYDRFWHMGTRFLVTSYSFVAVAKDSEWPDRELRMHMRLHYLKLFLLAQMQKASLLTAWARLAELMQSFAAEPSTPGSRRRLHEQHAWLTADLAHYVAVFEFSEVSNQEQAKELFDMMRLNLGCPELLEEVREQLQFASETEGSRFGEATARAQVDLQRVANLAVPAGVGIAAAGFWFSQRPTDRVHAIWMAIIIAGCTWIAGMLLRRLRLAERISDLVGEIRRGAPR